jgi:uncharacterized protein
MSEQNNLKIVQANYAAFGQGDLDTFFGNLSDEVIWESRYPSNIPYGGTFQGKGGIQAFFSLFDSSAAVQEFVPLTFIPFEDLVVVLGYEQLVAKTTGKTFRNEWVHVFTLDQGKVTKVQTSNNAAVVEAAFRPGD